MSAELEFAALLDQWRNLSEDEGKAIATGSWSHVQQLQSAKSLLQPRIDEVRPRIDPARHESQFRPLIESLIQLERRNQTLVDQRRASAQEQENALNRSDRNLRQLQKSYVPSTPQLWHSYS